MPILEKTDFNTEILNKLEGRYKVLYPVLENATYKSLVNYATDLETPIQRWYRYKEGYSVKLMQQLFDKYGVTSKDTVLDPFCGSGSTIVQAKVNKIDSVGFEINPFSAFLAKAKTQNYSNVDLVDFKENIAKLDSVAAKDMGIKKPNLSTIDKLYEAEVLNYLLNLREEIKAIKNEKAKDLFFLAWLGVLEEASNYRKAGNGLKIKRGKTVQDKIVSEVKALFFNRVNAILEDLPYAIEISKDIKEPRIFEMSSLKMDEVVADSSIKGVLFSPPYANCFDYTEIYKVELWMGEFIKEYSDNKELRARGVRSHLNGYTVEKNYKSQPIKELDTLVDALEGVELWDKRIPKMVKAYFNDMFVSLDKIYQALETDGFCAIVVSNSAYGGIVVPTDMLLAEYAREIGFEVSEIEVARFIITSSQQYTKTLKHKKFLRESIVHLRKK